MADGPAWDPKGYGGTLAPNVAVPGLPRQMVVTAVDLWTHTIQLRGTGEVARAAPPWLASAWGLATDLGSTHVFEGGGGGSLSWEASFAPSLPAGARELRLFVDPEGRRMAVVGDLPPEPAVTIALPALSPTVRRVAAVLDPAAEMLRSGFRGTVAGSPVRPTRVIPVATALDGAGERDMCVLSIDLRPDWLAVHIGGGGPLAVDDDLDEPPGRLLRHGWSAGDDLGGRYAGSGCSTHSGYPWTATATLAPALDPEARELTLTIPYPFGPGTVTATVDLR
jgi:hypothetical protein